MTKRIKKRMKIARGLYDSKKLYSIGEAIDLLMKYKQVAGAKFDESVDMVIKLGIDPNKPDQLLKSFVELPNGNGKKAKVLVFANDDVNVEKSLSLGVMAAGGDELVDRVANGSIVGYDKVVSTTAMMPKLVKIAKVLGPKGLMPSPKLGTVVDGDVTSVVKSLLNGRTCFKTEKDGSIKLIIGKVSFGKEKIFENLKEVISVVKQLKPSSVKANYFNGVVLTTTMGIGVRIKMNDIYSI